MILLLAGREQDGHFVKQDIFVELIAKTISSTRVMSSTTRAAFVPILTKFLIKYIAS